MTGSRSYSFAGLASNVGILTIANFAARVISAVTVIIVARLLGPDLFGPYAASLSLARLTTIVFGLGLNSWLLRSGGSTSLDLETRMGAIFSIKLVLGILWIIGLTAVSTLLNQDSFPTLIVLLCALVVWLEDLTTTVAVTFQSSLRNGLTALVLVLAQLLVLVGSILVIVFGLTTVEAFIAARAGAAIVSTVLALLLLRQLIGLRYHLPAVWQALRETRAFGVSVGLSMIMRQADVTIVGNWLGKTAAGFYAPAITLASTIFIVPNSVHGVLLPMLTRTYENEPLRIRRTMFRMLLLAAGIGTLMAGGLAILANPIVLIVYEVEYAVSGQILQIFSLLLPFRFLSSVLGAMLAAVEWQRYRVYVQTVAVAIYIMLNLYVVIWTDWGIFGVAWVYVLTEGLVSAGFAFCAWRWIHLFYNDEGRRDEESFSIDRGS